MEIANPVKEARRLALARLLKRDNPWRIEFSPAVRALSNMHNPRITNGHQKPAVLKKSNDNKGDNRDNIKAPRPPARRFQERIVANNLPDFPGLFRNNATSLVVL